MFTAYLDETGHSKDERQKFVGIAGLLARTEDWIVFEEKWKAALALPHFNIPHFHMTDFAARKRIYQNWSEEKRRKVFGKLMNVTESIYPLPFGAIMPMEVYRRLTEEQQNFIIDPYFLCFQSVVAACTVFLERMNISVQEKVALIFSDQVEFRHRALQIYEQVEEAGLYTRRSTPPDFRDMRDFAPLQAADIITYEMYKEFERQLYRPLAAPRFGYKRIELMSKRKNLQNPLFRFFSRNDLAAVMKRFEQAKKIRDLVEKKLKSLPDYEGENKN